MSGTAGKREPLVWRRAAPRVSVFLARVPGESERCERPQGASMYGDGVKVSAYSIRILDTSRCKYAYPEYRASEVSEKYPSIHASPGLEAHVSARGTAPLGIKLLPSASHVLTRPQTSSVAGLHRRGEVNISRVSRVVHTVNAGAKILRPDPHSELARRRSTLQNT